MKISGTPEKGSVLGINLMCLASYPPESRGVWNVKAW